MKRSVREFSSTQPPPAARQCFDRKGDALPLQLSSITTDLPGVTENNLGWLQVTIMVPNYHYCCGWTKPVCVPIDPWSVPIERKR